MMTFNDLPELNKTEKLFLDLRKTYYCDNYILRFCGVWLIFLDSEIVYTQAHKHFNEVLNCFDWTPWKQELDPIKKYDYIENANIELENLSLMAQYVSDPKEITKLNYQMDLKTELGIFQEVS